MQSSKRKNWKQYGKVDKLIAIALDSTDKTGYNLPGDNKEVMITASHSSKHFHESKMCESKKYEMK